MGSQAALVADPSQGRGRQQGMSSLLGQALQEGHSADIRGRAAAAPGTADRVCGGMPARGQAGPAAEAEEGGPALPPPVMFSGVPPYWAGPTPPALIGAAGTAVAAAAAAPAGMAAPAAQAGQGQPAAGVDRGVGGQPTPRGFLSPPAAVTAAGSGWGFVPGGLLLAGPPSLSQGGSVGGGGGRGGGRGGRMKRSRVEEAEAEGCVEWEAEEAAKRRRAGEVPLPRPCHQWGTPEHRALRAALNFIPWDGHGRSRSRSPSPAAPKPSLREELLELRRQLGLPALPVTGPAGAAGGGVAGAAGGGVAARVAQPQPAQADGWGGPQGADTPSDMDTDVSEMEEPGSPEEAPGTEDTEMEVVIMTEGE
jgi:hypothetical protein